ncbi:protein kinase domain-containing protein [Rhodocyclus tenuis]|uniref:protein kinase domain-containing protein n=1 Tax=Rhodocyclus tenuis TaxID=1066 RepID=UPI001F5B4C69|nr:protein kinase [Rhodocyclus tenuis]
MLTAMNPVLCLEGRILEGGWRVGSRLPIRGEAGFEGRTGGNFSVGYIAEREGVSAYMKVFDIGRALSSPPAQIATELQRISTAYLHEKELLELCDSARLDKIVKILGAGSIADGAHVPILYLIFEKADGDIRSLLGSLGAVEDAWRLKHLHQVAIGLAQLHQQKVAHQDLKPSNVFVFEEKKMGAKIGDLGRASRLGKTADHDSFQIAGDPNYAPPEQIYGYEAQDWVDRREACDLYHLGSLICFLFTGLSPTTGILLNIGRDFMPHPFGPWQGVYADALPFLTAAYTRFLSELESKLPFWCKDDLLALIRTACDPDVHRRGDPGARVMFGAPIGMDRYISRLDRLSKKAEVHARISARSKNVQAGA